MEKLNVAIVGAAGYWGPNVVRNVLKCPKYDKIFLYDLNIEKLKTLYGNYKNVTIGDNYLSALVNKDIHAAIICTPINTHHSTALDFLFAGKHILIQKPAALDQESARSIINLAEIKGLKVMAAHTFLFHPGIQYIREYLNILGRILHVKSTRINLGLFNRSNSVIDDLLPHDYSILSYLVQEDPIAISANGTAAIQPRLIDTVNSSLQYNNFNANIDVSWISAVKVRKLMIIGSDKTVVFDDCAELKLSYYDSGVHYDDVDSMFSYRKGNVYSPKLAETEAIFGEVSHFADSIINNREPICGKEQILKVAKMLETTKISVGVKGIPINHG